MAKGAAGQQAGQQGFDQNAWMQQKLAQGSGAYGTNNPNVPRMGGDSFATQPPSDAENYKQRMDAQAKFGPGNVPQIGDRARWGAQPGTEGAPASQFDLMMPGHAPQQGPDGINPAPGSFGRPMPSRGPIDGISPAPGSFGRPLQRQTGGLQPQEYGPELQPRTQPTTPGPMPAPWQPDPGYGQSDLPTNGIPGGPGWGAPQPMPGTPPPAWNAEGQQTPSWMPQPLRTGRAAYPGMEERGFAPRG